MSEQHDDLPKEVKYFLNKNPKRTYTSGRQQYEDRPRYRVLSRVLDSDEQIRFAYVDKEIVLERSAGDRTEWIARVTEDDRHIFRLTLQKYERSSGTPWRGYHFDFSPEQLSEFLKFVRLVKIMPLRTTNQDKHWNNQLEALLEGDEELFQVLSGKPELVETFVQNHLTNREIIALAYRKKQLSIFEQLLNDDTYFKAVQANLGKRQPAKPESVWQAYFEQNEWIFGYGLNYVFSTGFDNKKLEQAVAGYNILGSGKRVDALLRTRGVISSICFVEIKTHETQLLGKQYRAESWAISDEVAGAVAQVHRTVERAMKSLTSSNTSELEMDDIDGNPTGETAFLYQPKSYLVVGNLNEFTTVHGVNKDKFSSFEMFRRNLTSPEIITYDELYERASYIIEHSERRASDEDSDIFKVHVDYDNYIPPPEDLDDIPF